MSNKAWVNNGQASKPPPAIQPYATATQGSSETVFNAQEAKSLLRNAGTSLSYKPVPNQSNNAKSGGPWAPNSRNMANGKDFYVELRKQVTALQQGSAAQNSTRGG
ncbi:hypothetical protein P7C71_g53, partial [Lecanoromycetidae sp. Uapishka_2]